MKTIDVYSLAPICHRCNIVEQHLKKLENAGLIKLKRHNILRSIIVFVSKGVKPPVLIDSGDVIFCGRVASYDELRTLLSGDV